LRLCDKFTVYFPKLAFIKLIRYTSSNCKI